MKLPLVLLFRENPPEGKARKPFRSLCVPLSKYTFHSGSRWILLDLNLLSPVSSEASVKGTQTLLRRPVLDDISLRHPSQRTHWLRFDDLQPLSTSNNDYVMIKSALCQDWKRPLRVESYSAPSRVDTWEPTHW